MSRKIKNVPKYIEIRDDIKFKILEGEWKPGDKILSEQEYCKLYNVSRITVRKAISELEKENYLEKLAGRGTFIKDWDNATKEQSANIRSFTNLMKERGKEVISLEVELTIEKADAKMAGFLDIEPNADILQLKRIRAIENNEIIAYSINTFPYRKEFSINPEDYFGSLYEYFARHDIIFNSYYQYIEAQMPSPEISEKLRIEVTEPVLKSVKVSYNHNLNFNEHNLCYYVGSKYRHYIKF